ncbi:MAG: DUF308 domain-containing protein [Novosphingobium sp.]|nr:DUF308 domain-containing protein [Novosphingobium sp.]
MANAFFEDAASVRTLPRHNWNWFLVRGLLMIAFGIVTLVIPGATLLVFTMIFAAFSFADGIVTLIAGIRGARHHTERWGAFVLSGIAGIAVGVVFFLWPLLSTIVYATVIVAIIAAWAFIVGAMELSAAIRLRREIAGEWLLGLVGVASMVLALWLIYLLFVTPALTLLSVAWLIGFYAIVAGIALIVLAFRLRKRKG